MLQEKTPRYVPKESQKISPQAANPPITEPSVLTFNHGEEVDFQITKTISLNLR